MDGFSHGPLVKGAQAHVRALQSDDNIPEILAETQRRFGQISFAYRRNSEVDVSDTVGRSLFDMLCSACLDHVLLVTSGDPAFAEARCRVMLEELGALTPRQPKRSNSTKEFDFGLLVPPAQAKIRKKLGPNHFLADQERSSAPSRVFSSTHADPQKWMNNHLILQNLTKQDIYSLRKLRRPHMLVVRTVQVIALLTGRGTRPFHLFSVLAPAVLTDDLLTELLLLQKQMIPIDDLRRAVNMLRNLNTVNVRRINAAAGLLVDWAVAVTTNAYPSSSAKTFKHAIFARSNRKNGIDCIPVRATTAMHSIPFDHYSIRRCFSRQLL
eukprot:GEMP01062063.1.p1 GENE.GEMP01062063.1~~GEMP01062063.1.p1  ORF type:complete len:325 (+),score=33.87 GEMP01062063.1:60-1034(+)